MRFHGYEADAYRAGVLWVRAVVETARRLKKGNKFIIKRIDERADELDMLKLAEREENKNPVPF